MSAANSEAEKALREAKRTIGALKHASDDLEMKKKECSELKAALDKADISRVDTESKLQVALDKILLNESVYEKQLEEMRKSKQQEISQINSRFEKDYATRVQDSLDELKEYYEDVIARSRKEADKVYNTKLKGLQEEFEKRCNDNSVPRDQLRQFKSRVEQLTKLLNQTSAEKNSLKDDLREARIALEGEKEKRAVLLNDKDEEIRQLQAQEADMMKQVQDSIDENVRLDIEIGPYRKLLEGEGKRLHISPRPSPAMRPRPSLAKRPRPIVSALPLLRQPQLSDFTPVTTATLDRGIKRTYEQMLCEMEDGWQRSYTSTGILEAVDVDPQGAYLRIRNMSDIVSKTPELIPDSVLIYPLQEVSLLGFVLKNSSTTAAGEDTMEVTFIFPPASLKPGATSAVWSSDSGTVQHVPDNLAMFECKWLSGSSTKTQLIDACGTEIASFCLERKIIAFTSSVIASGVEEELYQQPVGFKLFSSSLECSWID